MSKVPDSARQYLAQIGRKGGLAGSKEAKSKAGKASGRARRKNAEGEVLAKNGTTRVLTLNGETMAIAEWADKTGLPARTIRWRLQAGKTVAEALSTEMF